MHRSEAALSGGSRLQARRASLSGFCGLLGLAWLGLLILSFYGFGLAGLIWLDLAWLGFGWIWLEFTRILAGFGLALGRLGLDFA